MVAIMMFRNGFIGPSEPSATVMLALSVRPDLWHEGRLGRNRAAAISAKPKCVGLRTTTIPRRWARGNRSAVTPSACSIRTRFVFQSTGTGAGFLHRVEDGRRAPIPSAMHEERLVEFQRLLHDLLDLGLGKIQVAACAGFVAVGLAQGGRPLERRAVENPLDAADADPRMRRLDRRELADLGKVAPLPGRERERPRVDAYRQVGFFHQAGE